MNTSIKIRFVAIFAIIGILPSLAMTAPAPGIATSLISNPQVGLYNSPHGFRISSGGTDWFITSPPPETRYIVTMYQSPSKNKDVHPSLTVRVDNLKRAVSLNDYVQQWMRDYPKFGFEVLGSKPFNHNDISGYVIDLKTKTADKQLRQVVFVRDRKAVILTCRDEVNSFAATLKSCNSIIKTFAWNKLTADEQAKANKLRVGPVESKATAKAGTKAEDDSEPSSEAVVPVEDTN